MGKLSAFWLAGIVAGAGSAVATAAQPNINPLRAGLQARAPAVSAASIEARNPYAAFKMNPVQKVAAGYGKVDNELAGISELAAHTASGQVLSDLRGVHKASRFVEQDPYVNPFVLVDMHVKGDSATVKSQLEALGAQHVSQFSNMTSAFIPVDRIKDAAALAGVGFIHASHARTMTGSVESQGDIIQNSYAVRLQEPLLQGSGVTVGVLSDSFNCVTQPASYANDITSGDLPANVTVLEEYNYAIGNPPPAPPESSTCYGATDEGRAIEQIIWDVAPGTTLMFHTAFNGEADFANGIIALAAAGAKVIDDDVGYFDEPIFQDGIVAQAIDQVNAQGVAYFSSAGNNAQQSYEGDWVDSGQQAPQGADNQGEELMLFTGADGTTQTFLPITAYQASYSLFLILEWDQPYVTGAPGSPGASSALDICVTDSSGNVIPTTCSGANLLQEDPYAIGGSAYGWVTDGTTTAYGIQIGLAGGTAPHHLKVIFGDDGYGTQAVANFATYSGTVQGHTGAAGAMSVGASPFNANPICDATTYPTFLLEPFSSSGGDPILFDNTGTALATPVTRQKPQIVSPDGVNTTFFAFQAGEIDSTTPGCSNGADSWNFFGTSAAAPHAAGIAALMMQAYPTAQPADIYQAMEYSAILPMIGWDPATEEPTKEEATLNFDTGYGFVQAPYALQGILVANSGTNLFVPQGNTVTLDGSQSTIPTGATPTYVWTQVSGPTVKLSNANSAHPSFPAVDTNTYAFVLTVVLANGQSSTSQPVAATVTGGPGPGGGGAMGLGLLVPGFMAALLRRRRKH